MIFNFINFLMKKHVKNPLIHKQNLKYMFNFIQW